MVDRFHSSAIARTMGMRIEYDDEARAVVLWGPAREYDHILDDVHGGVFATLLDNAGWFTIAAHYPNWVVTAELQTRFLSPAGGEALRARGEVVRTGQRLAVAEMKLWTESGRLCAIGSGTFAVTNSPYPK